jgi:hypothetical protein
VTVDVLTGERKTMLPFALVYDGEGDPPPPPPPPPVEKKEEKKEEKVKFTPEQQAYLNSILAEERRKAQAKNDQLITQLETEKNRVGTTAAEKAALESRIEDLRGEFATKEELTQRDTAKKVKELEDKNKQTEAQAKTWQDRFERNKRKVDLTQAAAGGKAYNAEQVVTILEPRTRLIEIVGEDGKGTGEYETKVKIQTKDKDGKPVTLDLSPPEAVKQMKDMPEFANLFISAQTGGLGGGSFAQRGGTEKPKHLMSTAEYIAERRKEKAAAGNRRAGK